MSLLGFLKSLVKVLILPTSSLFLFLFAAFLLRKKRPEISKKIAYFVVLCFYLLSIAPVSFALNKLVERVPPVTEKTVRSFSPEAIVILGGGVEKHKLVYADRPFPNDSTMKRVAYGAYWKKKMELPVLVTGGYACSHGQSEAEGMVTALSVYGIEPVWIEEESENTSENAKLSGALLQKDGVKKILLITSASHAQRAGQLFENEGFQVLLAPIDFEHFEAGPYFSRILIPQAYCLDSSTRAFRALLASLKDSLF